VSRRRPFPGHTSDHLPLEPTAPEKPISRGRNADQTAKAAIARRAKPSAVPGYVKLTITLDLKCDLAERLSARAIRETKNLEGVIADILAEDMR
jgi:hypothetical protein